MRGISRAAALAGCAILVAGCVTPMPPAKRQLFDQVSEKLKSQPAAMIGDGCDFEYDAGGNYLIRDNSQKTAAAATASAAKFLNAHGMQVSSTMIPFVCGSELLPGGMTIRVAMSDGTPPGSSDLPLPDSPQIKADPALSDAFLALVKNATTIQPANIPRKWLDAPPPAADAKAPADASQEKVKKGGAQIGSRPLGLNDDQLALIKSNLKTSLVWIVKAGGVHVPFGRTLAVVVISATVTAGHYAVMTTSGHGYYIALADLDNNEVVWGTGQGQLPGNPDQANAMFGDPWANTIFGVLTPQTASR